MYELVNKDTRNNKYYIRNKDTEIVKVFTFEGLVEFIRISGEHNEEVLGLDKFCTQYGSYKLIEKIEGTKDKYLCECVNCGSIKEKLLGHIKRGNGNTCRICNTYDNSNRKYKAGDNIGDYTLLKALPNRGNTRGIWKVQCRNCGLIKKVSVYNLLKQDECSECRLIDSNLGKEFGDFRLIEKTEKKGLYKCECTHCGKIDYKYIHHLKNGAGTNCKECNKMIPVSRTNISGEIYGDFRLIKYIPYSDGQWECECIQCGNKVTKKISDLKRNNGQRCLVCNYREHKHLDLTNMRFGYLVPINYKDNSEYEAELYEILKDTGVVRNVRSVLGGKELYLYCPSNKIAIEFNGNYWHNEIYKDRKYHRDKTIACIENGIHLVHIFEYEWLNKDKKKKIINLINSLFDINTQVIYGRNTEVRSVDKSLAYEFLDKYHMQGKVNSEVQIGLYDNDELVSLMTFGKPRFNINTEWELFRYVTKAGVKVIGGVSKLFKHFVEEYKPSNLITYCDISKFTGKVYEELGFKFEEYTEPSYVWINLSDNDIRTRYQTMRKNLIKMYKLDEDDKTLTESNIMQSLGYVRIYDCGNARYRWESA